MLKIIQLMEMQAAAREERLIAALTRKTQPSTGNRPGVNNGDANGDDGNDNGGGGRGGNKAKLEVKKPDRLQDDATYKSFKRWRLSWNNWATVTKLEKDYSREDQVATLRSYLSVDFITRLTYAIGVPEDTELTLQEVLEKITNYFRAQENFVVSRRKLVTRKQAESEKFDDFLVDLLEKADDAEIDDMRPEDWKTTLIVCGIRDRKTRKELLAKKPALNLQATIELCRENESGEKDADDLEKPARGINAIRGRGRGRGGYGGGQGRGGARNRSSSRSRRICYGCGGSFPHDAKFTCNPSSHAQTLCRLCTD